MKEGGPRSWPAPVKLNLFLHVTGRREDGYHDIQTLFQLIDWGDELRIVVDESGRITRSGGPQGVPPEADLTVRAARLLRGQCGVRLGAAIDLLKRVPPGAGLGGGSSDAATVLLVLNRLWRCGCSIDELARLGQRLGADVPVFVRGHSALAAGTGERLEPVELGERHYVLVLSAVAVSTAAAYSDPDLERNAPLLSRAEALGGAGRNVFEPVVRARHPGLARTLDELRAWGLPRLTGSGGGIFLAMPDAESAERAARELKCRYNVRAVRGIDRSPVHDMLDCG